MENAQVWVELALPDGVDGRLEADASQAATAPILRRHLVLVFIDRLDAAAARAIQYSRTLVPSELRAVHFIIDAQRAEELAGTWRRLGLAGIPLELREGSDRVIPRAAIQVVAEALADDQALNPAPDPSHGQPTRRVQDPAPILATGRRVRPT